MRSLFRRFLILVGVVSVGRRGSIHYVAINPWHPLGWVVIGVVAIFSALLDGLAQQPRFWAEVRNQMHYREFIRIRRALKSGELLPPSDM